MADEKKRILPQLGTQSPQPRTDLVMNMASSICSDGTDGESLKSGKDSGKLQVPKQKRQRPTSTPWTSVPQPLRHHFPAQWWWDFTVDFIMVLLTIPFFILLATVLYVNGKPVGEKQHLGTIEQAVKGAATIFPIAFAAVTGRAAVKFATWKLERGTSLGLLEQLMNSRTVASATMAPLQLRSFNLVSLGLISLWCMSPLGSQSVLHILSAPIVAIPAPRPISYYNLRQQSLGSPGTTFDNDFFNGYSMVFGASLLAPSSVKGSSMDLWGNPRIPYFSSIQSSGVKPDADGWIQIPQDGSFDPVYSSLFGLPIQNTIFGNTTVTVESSYIEMACNNISTTPMPTTPSGQILLTDQISPNGPYVSYRPVNLEAIWAIGYKGPDVRTFFDNTTAMFLSPLNCPDCLPGNVTAGFFDPGTLLYQEFYDTSNTTSVYCVPSQIYVESTILCQKTANGQFCQVIAQRPSQLPHQPSEITYLSFPDIVMGITNSLYNSTVQISTENPIQGFLYNSSSNAEIFLEPPSTSQYEPSGAELPFDSPLYYMSLSQFGDNLGQLVNAWIHGSFYNSTLIMTGANFTDLYQMELNGNAASFVPASPEDLSAMIQNQTSAFTVIANATANVQIYYCDFGWTSIFCLATSTMLCTTMLGVVFGRMTVVPDYLGYVSSLAKESQYMKIKDGGANLDGMERSRGIKDLQVRLGNVSDGTGEVGRLAFGRVEDTKPVQRDRLYI